MSGEPLTITQQQILAILPKISAPLSIFGSSFIPYESILDFRRGRNAQATRKTECIQRALMGQAVFDVLFSWGWFMSTWMAPQDSDKIWAVGNQTTCDLQGFLTYVSIGVPLYSMVQVAFTLLLVQYSWTEQKFRWIEPVIHCLVWIYAFASATAVVTTGYFSADIPHVPFCANIDPPECYGVPEGEPLPEVCGTWMIVTLVLFLVPLWTSCLVSLCCVASLSLFVRSTRQRLMRYTIRAAPSTDTMSGNIPRESTGTIVTNRTITSPSRFVSLRSEHVSSETDDNAQNSSSFAGVLAAQRQISNRGILYASVFLLTWIWLTIGLGLEMSNGKEIFGIWACQAFFEPLQGFWNLLIFCQNRPSSRSKLRRGFFSILTCCGLFTRCCGFCFKKETSHNDNAQPRPNSKISSKDTESLEAAPESALIHSEGGSMEKFSGESARSIPMSATSDDSESVKR